MADGIAVAVRSRSGRSGLSDATVCGEPAARGVGNPASALLGRTAIAEPDVRRAGELRLQRFERVEDKAAAEVARRSVLRDQRGRDQPTRGGLSDGDTFAAFS
jgi:hypothetical protein